MDEMLVVPFLASLLLVGAIVFRWFIWGRAARIFKKMTGEHIDDGGFGADFHDGLCLDVFYVDPYDNLKRTSAKEFRKLLRVKEAAKPVYFIVHAYIKKYRSGGRYQIGKVYKFDSNWKMSVYLGDSSNTNPSCILSDCHKDPIRIDGCLTDIFFRVLKMIPAHKCVADYFIKRFAEQAVPILEETKGSLGKSKRLEAIRLAFEKRYNLEGNFDFDIMDLVEEKDGVPAEV